MMIPTRMHTRTRAHSFCPLSRSLARPAQDMIHFVQRQDPGKYILQKEPQKPAVRLFSVPENAFDGSSSESEGEDHM